MHVRKEKLVLCLPGSNFLAQPAETLPGSRVAVHVNSSGYHHQERQNNKHVAPRCP